MLVRYVFGTYDCSGSKLENAILLDPRRIVGVKARVAGRHDSEIIIDGFGTWSVSGTPEAVAAIIEETTAKAIEAQRAETAKTGSVEDESAVGNADLPK